VFEFKISMKCSRTLW